jgi:response regulator of citrate/malate metabolism
MADKISTFIEEQLEAIDEKIQEIDSHKVVRAAQKLLDQKQQLQAARRALLGAGSTTGSNGGNRVTQQEVIKWFEANEGWHSVASIAGAMGHGEAVIRGHLNRGKDERFEKNGNSEWRLRDPEREEDDDGEE